MREYESGIKIHDDRVIPGSILFVPRDLSAGWLHVYLYVQPYF